MKICQCLTYAENQIKFQYVKTLIYKSCQNFCSKDFCLLIRNIIILMQLPDLCAKILLIGQSNIGKTSLLYRRQGKFLDSDKYRLSREENYTFDEHRLKVYFAESKQQNTQILRYIIKGADAICFCFSLANYETFKSCQDLIGKVEKFYNYKFHGVPFFLIGLQSDLQHDISLQEIQDVAIQKQIRYFQTSSKQNEGVNAAINDILIRTYIARLQGIKKRAFLYQQRNSIPSALKLIPIQERQNKWPCQLI